MRSPTRISARSHLVCAVHCWSGSSDRKTPSTRSLVCWWHPDDRIMSTTQRQLIAVSFVKLFGWCKTELLWCATARRQSQLSCAPTPLRVGSDQVKPTSSVWSVRDLGIYFCLSSFSILPSSCGVPQGSVLDPFHNLCLTYCFNCILSRCQSTVKCWRFTAFCLLFLFIFI